MESTYPTRAIILNRRDWREADRLVSVYTPDHGRLDLVVRGARKLGSKLAAHLEPLSLSRLLVVKGKGRDYVGAALMEKPYLGIKQDLNKLYFSGKALSLFCSLVREEESDPALFSWLEKWLDNLDEAGGTKELPKEDGRFRLALFSWRLLVLSGYGPILDRCAVCGRIPEAGKNRFDLSRGGLVCPECASKEPLNGSVLPISDNLIKLLRVVGGEPNAKPLKFPLKLIREWENLNSRLVCWQQS
ncbi:MAG: DNA repair protein RecO [Bacillota bacterium]